MTAAASTVQGFSLTDRMGATVTNNAIPPKYEMCDFGRYFVTTNPTPGTALAYNVQASYSATVPFLYLFNSAALGGKEVYIDYIKLIVTVVPASGTQIYYAVLADTAARAVNTDHTTALTPVCPNLNAAPTSILSVKAQNNATASALAAASANARLVARGSLGGVPIIGDELCIDFGANDITPYSGLTATAAVACGRKTSCSPALILGPQCSAMIAVWSPSNASTGLSYELEMGTWEV